MHKIIDNSSGDRYNIFMEGALFEALDSAFFVKAYMEPIIKM